MLQMRRGRRRRQKGRPARAHQQQHRPPRRDAARARREAARRRRRARAAGPAVAAVGPRRGDGATLRRLRRVLAPLRSRRRTGRAQSTSLPPLLREVVASCARSWRSARASSRNMRRRRSSSPASASSRNSSSICWSTPRRRSPKATPTRTASRYASQRRARLGRRRDRGQRPRHSRRAQRDKIFDPYSRPSAAAAAASAWPIVARDRRRARRRAAPRERAATRARASASSCRRRGTRAMSASELASLARARGLPTTATLLEQFASPRCSTRAPRRPTRVSSSRRTSRPSACSAQMARRGLDPHAACARSGRGWPIVRSSARSSPSTCSRARCSGRPTKRSPPNCAPPRRRSGALASAAGKLALDLNAHPAAALLERFARDRVAAVARRRSLALSFDFHLGALDELVRRGRRARARRRGPTRACAPSGASRSSRTCRRWRRCTSIGSRARSAIVTPRSTVRDALRRARSRPRSPATPCAPATCPTTSADLAQYLVCRIQLALGNAEEGWAMCEDNLSRRDRRLGPLRDRSRSRAHLGTLAGERPVRSPPSLPRARATSRGATPPTCAPSSPPPSCHRRRHSRCSWRTTT